MMKSLLTALILSAALIGCSKGSSSNGSPPEPATASAQPPGGYPGYPNGNPYANPYGCPTFTGRWWNSQDGRTKEISARAFSSGQVRLTEDGRTYEIENVNSAGAYANRRRHAFCENQKIVIVSLDWQGRPLSRREYQLTGPGDLVITQTFTVGGYGPNLSEHWVKSGWQGRHW